MNASRATLPLGLGLLMAIFLVPLSARAAAPTCTLVASPSSVVPGRGFTLTLNSSSPGVTSGSVNNGVGTISIGSPRQSVSIAQTTTYTATVSNVEGTGTCSATVTVDPFTAPEIPKPPGGSGGPTTAQKLQGLGQLLSGLGALQGALGGNNAQNQDCMSIANPDCGGVCGKMMKGSPRRCQDAPEDKWGCQCTNRTNQGVTQGICQGVGRCLGQSTQNRTSGALGGQQGLGGGLGALGQILQGIGTLMGAGQPGAGGAGAGAFPQYGAGCIQYVYTSTPTGNPCEIYQPGTSGQITDTTVQSGLASDLLGALGESGQSPVSGSITNQPPVTTQTDKPDVGATTSVRDGLTGNVRLNPGATIFANLRDGLTEVAGFFGGNTFGGEGSQSALSRLCSSRPWAGGNFLARLAPDNFFDTLCRSAGYQVGQTQTGGAPRTQTFTTTGDAPAVATTTNPFEPRADIRAEPASVRLGTRTYVFWASQGVTSCAVRGPNFMQDTLQGAGATVPITGPTTYLITCTAPDGREVRDSITVQLAI